MSAPESSNLRDLAQRLAEREQEYRIIHDQHGDEDIETGRAWDRMRKAGDKVRAALREAREG